jgi:hypothetical protein
LIWDVVRDYLLSQRNQQNVIEISKMNHPTLVGAADNPGVADYEGKIV